MEKKISETTMVSAQSLAGIDDKVYQKLITAKDDFEKRLLDIKKKISDATMVSVHGVALSIFSRPCIKLPTYDEKPSLEMAANGYGYRMKAIHLAERLREAADVLEALPNDKIN